jgi:hypothetical protein
MEYKVSLNPYEIDQRLRMFHKETLGSQLFLKKIMMYNSFVKMYITSGFNLGLNSHFFLFVIIEPCDF